MVRKLGFCIVLLAVALSAMVVVRWVALGYSEEVIGPYKVAARDFTGDGKTDLLWSYHDAGDLVVESGDGTGRFGGAVTSSLCANGNRVRSGGYAIAAGDVDEDGTLDVVVGCIGRYVVVARNRGGGAFEQIERFETEGSAKGVNLSDLDGDSHLDLLYTSRALGESNELSGGKLYLRHGRGDGTFGEALIVDAGNSAYCVDTGDMNGDGLPGIIVANERGGSVSYWPNRSDSIFASPIALGARVVLATASPSVNDARAADVNGDGNLDIVAVMLEGTLSIFAGQGDGAFASEQTYAAGDSASFLAINDLNRDGDMDIVVSHWREDYISVFTNDGTGHLTREDYRTAPGTYGLDTFDSNGNGLKDVVVASYRGGVLTILQSDGYGGFLGMTTLPRSVARSWWNELPELQNESLAHRLLSGLRRRFK